MQELYAQPMRLILAAVTSFPGLQATLVSAAVWLAACVLCALIFAALLLFIARRRTGRRGGYRPVLVAALFLVALGSTSLIVESRAFSLQQPLVAAPVALLFLIFFYLCSDHRFVGTWTRLLTVPVVFTQISAFIPQQKSNQPPSEYISHIAGLLGFLTFLADIVAITGVALGILTQIYARYRRLGETGQTPRLDRRDWRSLTAMLVGAGYLVLCFAVALATSPGVDASPVLIAIRTLFYLLAVLVPIAAGVAILRPRLYDRDALRNRVLVYAPFALCLLLVYALSMATLLLVVPGFAQFSSAAYLPFFALLAVLMVTLFGPLNRLLTDGIDRRFFARRHAAVRLLSGLGGALRDEQHLDVLGSAVLDALGQAFQPKTAALWLHASPNLLAQYAQTALPGRSGGRASARAVVVELRLLEGTRKQPSTLPTLLVLAPDDPMRSLLRPSSVIEIAYMPTPSPLLSALRDSRAELVLPLLSRDKLVGLIALGPPGSGPSYTVDERELLVETARAAAPVLEALQLARVEEVETRQRERVEQELQTARRIQEALLPKTVPELDGWQIATCYQPAREVGGDFYDFVPLADGRLGLVLGDVTDKGIPAALVMATTRSMLRAVASQPAVSPGQVLAHLNELLCADLPPAMFVTCFYAVLDTVSGQLRFANAGQDCPYLRRGDASVHELRARGMPLGLLPQQSYDEAEMTLQAGDALLFFSDGLVEAHDPAREMFGLPRLGALLGAPSEDALSIVSLLHELALFTGPGWEQEDDITLVTLRRLEQARVDASATPDTGAGGDSSDTPTWRTIGEWRLASEPGNERQAIDLVDGVVRGIGLAARRREPLLTAVGEAVMNAMEHGNRYQPDNAVELQVRTSDESVSVRIVDAGGRTPILDLPPPDLHAKLAEADSPRGWGLFLVKNLVDEVRVYGDGDRHIVELIMSRQEREDSVEQG